MYAVGLTGGIASGKSTVRREFEKLGIDTFCADIISKQAVAPNSEGLEAIINRYSKDILLADNSLNRAKLKEIIFDQPTEKIWLENLIHPIVRDQLFKSAKAAQSPYCILDIPLLNKKILIEYTFIQKIISIEVPPHIQIERLTARDNISSELAKKIIDSQATSTERYEISNFCIVNTSLSIPELQAEVKSIHTKLLKLSAQPT